MALYVNKLENLQHGQVGQHMSYDWQASSNFDAATQFAVGGSNICLGKLKRTNLSYMCHMSMYQQFISRI